MSKDITPPTEGELLIYPAGEGGGIRVLLAGETVWLTQRQIAELYQVTVPTVNEHLANAYEDGELEPERTIRKLRMVQSEGGREVRRILDHYSLEAIIAVGYRVRSTRGTEFRQTATTGGGARGGSAVSGGFAADSRGDEVGCDTEDAQRHENDQE